MFNKINIGLNTRIKLSDLFFFVSYTIYILMTFLINSMFSRYFLGVYDLVQMFCVVLLVFKEMAVKKMNKKSIFSFFIITIFIVLIWNIYSSIVIDKILWILIFLFCARNVNFNSISNVTVYLSLIMFLVIYFSAKTGIIMNIINDSGRFRDYMGFSNVFLSSSIIFNVSLLLVLQKKEKIKISMITLLFFVNCWVYVNTGNRLIFLTSIILILGSVFLKKYTCIQESKIVWLVCSFSFVICCMLSITISLLYNSNNKIMRDMNAFLGNRLAYGKESLMRYGVNLWGQNITWIGNGIDSYGVTNNTGQNYNYVDSIYIQLLQKYGVVLTIFFIILITYFLLMCYKMHNIYILFAFCIISVHGLIDDTVLLLPYNTIWLVIGNVLIENGKYIKQYKKRTIGIIRRKYL